MVKNYKLMKCFDCSDMPENIQREFFSQFDQNNDCHVTYYVCESKLKKKSLFKDTSLAENQFPGKDYGYEKGDCIVSDWLLENGAEIGEEVIVSYWW